MGLGSIATGEASVALGRNSYAPGIGAAAIGNSAFATGPASTAFGLGTLASGQGSMAFGENSSAAGFNSVAGGRFSKATGDVSVAIGTHALASGWHSLALGHQANTNGQDGAVVISSIIGGVVSGEVKAVAPGQFVMRASRFWIGNNSNVTAQPGQLIVTSTGAYLSVGGAWVNSSDVNRKENFALVDGETVLNKLAALPIQSWNYRDEDSTTRHVGPTAQDFRAAFGLGATETAIATVDADGVALTAVQALERRTREQAQEIQELRSALEQLRDRLEQWSKGLSKQ
jgi:autotransporter adhesin